MTDPIALRHRARGRALAAAASVAIVVASVAGAIGLLPGAEPTGSPTATPATNKVVSGSESGTDGTSHPMESGGALAASQPRLTVDLPARTAAPQVTPRPTAGAVSPGIAGPSAGAQQPAVPADSGAGRRIVFDLSAQRVWLVANDDGVIRTYLGSGSRSDILQPGHYQVFSRSRHAVSFNYRESMEYMVRFAHGKRSAIGFHSIPVDSRGHPVQTRQELGAPRSAGCIRQTMADARALWRFAPIGTNVWVVA